eukprot:3937805-Rhodomonas_salina.2
MSFIFDQNFWDHARDLRQTGRHEQHKAVTAAACDIIYRNLSRGIYRELHYIRYKGGEASKKAALEGRRHGMRLLYELFFEISYEFPSTVLQDRIERDFIGDPSFADTWFYLLGSSVELHIEAIYVFLERRRQCAILDDLPCQTRDFSCLSREVTVVRASDDDEEPPPTFISFLLCMGAFFITGGILFACVY